MTPAHDPEDRRFAFLTWVPEIKPDHQPVKVTLLSGFLGSGKTTLLKHLLRERPGGRFGVVVNDVGDVNIDAADLKQNFPEEESSMEVLTELTQGCICCSIGNELADSLVYLWEEYRPAHIFIEASGMANPRNVLQAFYSRNFAGHSLEEVFVIANMVSVLDCGQFLEEWDRALADKRRKRRILLSDPRHPYVELIMDQVETCDILVLNKQDKLSEQDQARVLDIFSDLNPRARLLPVKEGQVDPDEILEAQHFDLHETQRGGRVYHYLELEGPAPVDVEDLTEDEGLAKPSKSYGLTTMVFRSRNPARQQDLFRVLTSEIPGLVRAKGFYWTSDELASCGVLSLAGGILRADRAGKWFIDLVQAGKEKLDEMPPPVRAAWDGPIQGDRRQEIVLIGVDLDRKEVMGKLEKCLEPSPYPKVFL